MQAKTSVLGGVIAFVLAISCCWLPALAIGLGGASGLIALSTGLEQISGPLLVAGSGLLLYGGYQFYQKRRMNTVLLISTITCPECGQEKEEIMPTDACQFFYQCTVCQVVLKPKPGDCCVFCSYGTVDCPPIQQGEKCCE